MTLHWRDLGKAGRLDAVKSAFRPGMSTREIGQALGVSKSAICGIYKRYPEAMKDCPLTAPKGRKGVPKPEGRKVREQYLVWTADKRAEVAAMLEAGSTGDQIGRRFGVKRNSIIGLVRRDPKLNAIGFARGKGKARPRLSDEELRQRRNETVKRYRAKRGPHPSPKPERTSFKPVIVSNNINLMVQDFIAQNGVRRFEQNARSDYQSIAWYLKDRGYTLLQRATRYTLAGSRGRPRNVTWKEAIALVDKLRRAEGLQPFMAA